MIIEIKEFLDNFICCSGDFIDHQGEWQRGKIWACSDFTVMEFESGKDSEFLYHNNLYSQEEFLKFIKMKAFW